jgi:hypothetical protein
MKQYKDTPYYITEDGKVFRNGKELTGFILKKKGKPTYKVVSIFRKNKYVHRLVGELYIPNPDNLPQIDHKDSNKLNNHYTNLEWVTNKENMDRAIKNGLMKHGEQYEHSKLTELDIKYIRENYIPNHPQFSGVALSRKFGVGNGQISRIVNNTRWKHLT